MPYIRGPLRSPLQNMPLLPVSQIIFYIFRFELLHLKIVFASHIKLVGQFHFELKHIHTHLKK